MRRIPVSSAIRLYTAVGAGSALGAVARHACALAFATAPGAFPWTTLGVNGLGAFLIGAIAAATADGARFPASPALRQFLVAGFCGGFTTFSIFSLETIRLAQTGHTDRAALYVTLSLVVWMVAVRAGYRTVVRTGASRGR